MEVVLSQFKKSLIASGLMTADEVEAFIDGLPPDDKPKDGKALAQILVRQKKLTKFQAQAIFQGKTKGLIMGDYIVLDRIGQGGMGQVYKARHKVMKRVVALKTLPTEATKLEAAVKRFHREVEVAARLSHSNIVTAFDAGETHGTHYLVMELVEGSDLASHVRQGGRLSVQTAIEYTLQAARGLEYAHGRDVIHRDIKPSNLVLDKEGTVKVLDMGLARLNEAIGPDDSTGQQTLTGTGQAMGTIDYMPPEQAENVKEADERSDIYSLGCTLHYFLTGRSVYGGDTTVMRLLAHRDADIPSLRAERPEVPEHLDAVFAKMVAKKREDRFASMTEVIVELQKCADPKPDQLAETADLGNTPLGSAYAETQGVLKSDQTPGDESLMLGLPVVSPVASLHRRLPKKDNKILFGSIIAAVCLLLLVVGVFIATRSDKEEVVQEQGAVGVEESVEEEKPSTPRVEPKGEGGGRNEASSSGANSATGLSPVTATGSSGNWALKFDGQSGGVTIPKLDYDGTYPITIEAIVTPETPARGTVIRTIGCTVSVSESGRQLLMTLGMREPKARYLIWGDGELTKGVPVHLAGVVDGDTARFYVDGSKGSRGLVLEEGVSENRKQSPDEAIRGTLNYVKEFGFTIGHAGNAEAEGLHFHGIIDEVRISNIARYTEDFIPQRRFEPDEHTMALYHFDEGSGDVLHDSSGNGHDGQIVGAKWVKVDEGMGVVADDPDRRAAEWVLGVGGRIVIDVNGEKRWVDAVEKIPEKAFALIECDLRSNDSVDDDGLRNLRGLANLQGLFLDQTQVGDIGLEYVAQHGRLEDLDLDFTSVTDSGLKNLRGLTNLRELSLSNTAISDLGLENLGQQRTLQSLNLTRTKVTDAGLGHLKAMPRIRKLVLTATAVSDSGLEHVTVLKEMRALGLVTTDVTDVGLTKLTLLSELVALEVESRQITDRSVQVLNRLPHLTSLAVMGLDFTYLTRLANIKHLFLLTETGVSDSDIATLKAALPDCQIEIGQGEWHEHRESLLEMQPTQPPLAIAPFTPEQAEQHQQAWADYLGVPVEFENSIGMKMVLIPPGEFMMGSSEEEIEEVLRIGKEQGWLDDDSTERVRSESPQHRVRITKPFYMATCELTVGQFKAFVESAKYETQAESDGVGGWGFVEVAGEWKREKGTEFNWRNTGAEQMDQHPVVNITWNDATAFCSWLCETEHQSYTLPTEAQWEFACRAGSTGKWCCGDDAKNPDEYAWHIGNSDHIRKPVGKKPANPFGICDMHGNVSEWCLDWHSEDYYNSSPTDDPVGPSSSTERVVRSGNFIDGRCGVRSAARDGSPPGSRLCSLGFRPVMLIDPDNPPKIPPQPPAESAKPEPTATSETKTETKEADKTPKISWKLRHTLEGNTDLVNSVAFHPKGQMVVSGSRDGTIRFWDVQSGKQLRFIQDIGKVKGLAVSPDGTLLAAVGGFLGAKLWNLSTGHPVGQYSAGQIEGQFGAYNGHSATFSPDGSMLAWCSGDVWLFNLRTKEAGHLPIGGEGDGTSIAFSGNGKLLASGAADGSVRLWDTKTGRLTVPLATQTQDGGKMSVVFSRDGTLLIAGGHGENANLRLWNVQTGNLLNTFDEPGALNAIAASPAHSIVASGGQQDENRIRLRDMTSGTILAELDGHEDHINSLAFSPDGKLLVSGSRDNTVRIWEIEMEQE